MRMNGNELEDNLRAVDRVINDLRLEGFEFQPEEIENLRRIARGELTTGQHRQNIVNEIMELRKTHPEYFSQG